MTHSPYGRNPKTTNKPSSPPRGKTAAPEEPRATNAAAELGGVGQEPSAPKHSLASLALWASVEEFSARLSFGIEPPLYPPDAVAHILARALYGLAHAGELLKDITQLFDAMPKEMRRELGEVFDQVAATWLERGAGKVTKKRGRGNLRANDKPTDVNPDAGHGAADGFGGTDFPTPGPDEDRPQ